MAPSPSATPDATSAVTGPVTYVDIKDINYKAFIEIPAVHVSEFRRMIREKGISLVFRDANPQAVLYFCFIEHGFVFRINAHNLKTLEELETAIHYKILVPYNDRMEFVDYKLSFPAVTIEEPTERKVPEDVPLTKIVFPKQYLSAPEKIIAAVRASGYESYEAFKDGYARGFLTKDDSDEAGAQGYDLAKHYHEALEGGFKSRAEYEEARAAGFKSRDLWEFAKNRGYTNYKNFKAGEHGGFENAAEFKRATAKGIFSKKELDRTEGTE